MEENYGLRNLAKKKKKTSSLQNVISLCSGVCIDYIKKKIFGPCITQNTVHIRYKNELSNGCSQRVNL